MKNTAALVLLMGLMVLGGGCAKDKDQEDWKKEQLAEQLAKYQEVSGTYQGEAISRQDGSSLGPITLEIKPDTRVGGRNDGINADPVPVLRGRVTFHGLTKGTAIFNDAYYDPEFKSFKTTIKILKGDGVDPDQIDISAVLSGQTLNGGIEAWGYTEDGADFSLVKNAPLPGWAPPTDGRQTQKLQFESIKTAADGKESKVALVIGPGGKRSDQLISQLLMPLKLVDATLYFSSDITILFPVVEWNQRIGSLSGRIYLQGSGQFFHLTLTCQETEFEPGLRGFECKYLSTLSGNVQEFKFLPKGN